MKAMDEAALVGEDATVGDAMRSLEKTGYGLALLTDASGVLRGVVTDGDVRRALLAGSALEDPVVPHANPTPFTVGESETRAGVLDVMQAHGISVVPVVDGAGRVVGLHLLRGLIGKVNRPNVAVIMAGGRGRRLGPITDEIPKPMVKVAGRPILERLILHLVGNGISKIALSVNYLSDQVESHFGDGGDFGCEIGYLRESPDRPLGTAGSLSLLRGAGIDPKEPLLVMNGDLVTQFSVAELLDRHTAGEATATVAARRYAMNVPFGVLNFDDNHRLTAIREKPTTELWINAGIYVVEPEVVASVPSGVEYDMTALLADEVARGGTVLVWPLEEEWHDVGQPDDLRRAQGHL